MCSEVSEEHKIAWVFQRFRSLGNLGGDKVGDREPFYRSLSLWAISCNAKARLPVQKALRTKV